MTRLGMDVDAVEHIGRGLQSDADQLAALTGRVDACVRRLAGVWQGRDARDFVGTWWPQHRSSLAQVRDQVAGLGQSALDNAAEQRGASEATVGDGTASSHPEGTNDGSWWLTSAGQLHDFTEALADTDKGPRAFGVLGNVLGVFTIVAGTADGAQAYESGDWGRLGGDGVDVGLAAAGLGVGIAVAAGVAAAPAVGAGLVAFAIAKSVIDVSLPYSAQAQDEVLDYEAQKLYGVNRADLTPSQASGLADRYSGLAGPLTMISDKIDESTDEAARNVGGAVKNGADGITSIWHWVTGH